MRFALISVNLYIHRPGTQHLQLRKSLRRRSHGVRAEQVLSDCVAHRPRQRWKKPLQLRNPLCNGAGCVQNLALPAGWAGRFYGKIGCNANGGGCFPGPFTLAEINFVPGADDFYDISLVDGYNLPMTFTPVDSRGMSISGASDRRCAGAGCTHDLLKTCPSDLQVHAGSDNRVVACKSACSRFGSPQYCCTGSFSCGPSCCPPTDYSRIFSAACPYAYSYAYDDRAGTFTCPNAKANGGYQVNLCI